MVIALTGSCGRPGSVKALRKKLKRRGFRVETAESAGDETDIVLMPLVKCSTDRAAKQIEKIWTEHWQGWFVSKKRKNGSKRA